MDSGNPYDDTLNWQPGVARQTYYEPTPHLGRSTKATRASEQVRVQAAPRMSKADALARISRLKKAAIIGSIATFGLCSALVAGNIQATAASSSATPASQSPPIGDPSSPGGFFHHRGGGYGFGNGNGIGDNNGGYQQSPNTRTRTS